LKSFFELLDNRLVKILPRYDYKKPTEIQELAFPIILKTNYDVLLVSPTGSGKTEAVLFPICSILLNSEIKNRLFAIYVTPLRALNRDIFDRMQKLFNEVGIEIAVRHGDTPISQRKVFLTNPPHILITTPETLDALCVIEKFNKFLKNLKFLIIDEIHELIEGFRGSQLITLVERLKYFNNDFRKVCLSATVSDPLLISKLIFNNNNFSIKIASSKLRMNIKIDYIKYEEYENLFLKIKELLEKSSSTLIFVNTRSFAEYVSYKLQDYSVMIHHGSLNKEIREEVEKKLKEGKIKAVVATSSLEHGIDIKGVDLVIQINSPIQATILKQRIGRSMHRIGGIPQGYIFVFNPIEALECYILSKNANEEKLENLEIYSNPLGILTHHIIGILLIKNEINIEELYKDIRKISIFKDLKFETFLNLINFLTSIKLCFNDGEKIKVRKIRCLPYYFDTISTIFEEPLYTCINFYDRKTIGKVDGGFLKEAYENNAGIVLAGKAWKIVDINDDRMIAELEPLEEAIEIPIWTGELLPVHEEVSLDVFKLLNHLLKNYKNGINIDSLFNQEEIILLDSTVLAVKNFIKDIILHSPYIPSNDTFIIERQDNIINIINPRGSKINKALGIFIKGLLGDKLYFINYTPYGISLYLKSYLSTEYLVNVILQIPEIVKNKELLRDILYNNSKFISILKQTGLFLGVIKKEAIQQVSKNILLEFKDTIVEEESINNFLYFYLELNKLLNLINLIKERKIKILIYELKSLTPLSMILVSKLPFIKDIVKSSKVFNIFEAVEQRLLDEELLFLCIGCKSSFKNKIKYLPEKIVCKKCGSIRIAAINPYDENLSLVTDAFIKSNKKILKKYENDYKRLLLSSELIAFYGKLAAFVMAGRGIGPEFARRILTKWDGNKENLIKQIIEYEVKFAQTYKYWSD